MNGVTFGPASMLDIHQLHKHWYDWTLRGLGARPDFLKKRVAYYVAGSNGDVWRYADSLEAVATETKRYFLSSAGGRATDVFGGDREDRGRIPTLTTRSILPRRATWRIRASWKSRSGVKLR